MLNIKLIQVKLWLFISIFTLLNNLTEAQIQPVTLTANLKAPTSIFLYDYSAAGSNIFTVTSVFNDLNEAGREVYFKILIESNAVKLQTNPNSLPPQPVYLSAGVALNLSGDDLEPYLNYNNLIYDGLSKSEFIRTGGRLPTGFYTFCIEVFDYSSKKKISNTACATAYIQLNTPAIITLPLKESAVPIEENQNITFQWQASSVFGTGNILDIEYSLSLYEILPENDAPMNAIANKQVVKLFESDYLPQTSFNYNLNHPALESGKRYAVQIHSKDKNARNSFENNGYSEPSWFYYGYPEDGKISLIYPENNKSFSINDSRIFNWSAPDKLLSNQEYFYKLKIVKLNDSLPENAIVDNPAWFEETTDNTKIQTNWSILVPKLDPIDNYAWQLTAHTKEQKIAESEVYEFSGPPLLESFWVGNHKVLVSKTTNRDFNNLSGEGKVRISEEGDLFEVKFENISLVSRSSEWYLTSGEIKSDLSEHLPIDLKPDFTRNGKALFYPDSLKIRWSQVHSRNIMTIKGHTEWDLPLAVDSVAKGIVKTESKWLYFDTYKIIGFQNLTNMNHFNLLEPLNHKLSLKSESKIHIGSNNTFRLELSGNVFLPEKIKNTQNKRMKVPFTKVKNLFYIKMTSVDIPDKITLVNNANIALSPLDYYIDFSDEESPEKLSSNKEWTGVYFEKYNLTYDEYVDKSYQLKFKIETTQSISTSEKTEYEAWTRPGGLELFYSNIFEETESYFNTFPSKLSSISLKIEDSYVSDSYFKGSIKIPVISETKDFSYTIPINDDGFAVGFLDEDLKNTSFSFNEEGGQQKINLKILKAVFLYNEKLQMSVDIDWPELDVKIPSVNGFCAWGNYAIGFYQPNATVNLTNQVTGTLNGFDITLETLGCGSSEGAYGIGTNAVVVMAENVSGSEGAPNINLYSVCPNEFAPQVEEKNINFFDETDLQNTVDSLNNTLKEVEEIQTNLDNISASSGEITGLVQASLANSTASYEGTPINSENLSVQTENETEDEIIENEFSIEKLIQALEVAKLFCSEEQIIKIDNIISKIQILQTKEAKQLFEAIADVKGFAKKMLKQQLDKVLNKVIQKIDLRVAKINEAYTKRIDSLLLKSNNFVNKAIDSTMNLVSRTVINLVKNDKIDVAPIVQFSTQVTATALKQEINNSVNESVYKNLVSPVTDFVSIRIGNSITGFIRNEIGGLGHEIIENGKDTELEIDFEQAFIDVRDSIKSDLSDINLEATVFNTVNDILTGITVEGLVDKILEEVVAKLTDPVQALGTAAQLAMNTLSDGSGDLASSLLSNVEMDFSNVGEKLRNGEIDEIIKFDPSHIHVKTKSVEFDAYAKIIKDDPTWGDCFKADVNAKVTLDFEFSANATFINGKVEDYNYWFVELGAHDLNVAMTPTPFALEGADGRIFHHMSYNETEYLPDNSTKLGLALQLYMFDIGSRGSLIKFDVTAEALFRENGFILEMRGNANIGNKEKEIKGVNVKRTIANADGFIRYNSIEKHLVGIMAFETNTAPLFCAGGEMGLDIKSFDDWNIYVGKRETPIYIKLLCSSNFSVQSWIDIYNSHIDLGLKIRQAIAGQTPWLGRLRFYADIGFDFETSAIVRWQPKFGIDEAMVALSLWADIGADWKKLSGKIKRYSLVDIQLHGLLAYKSVPETNIKGEMGGHAKVCGIGIGFDLGVDHTFR